ncbi:hypothetical protein Asppvi_000172 [Aspergillus pseudoviridinutans]|uniref:Allergen Asp f 4 n=1 Tax=Aspergillus pseudoviridinutans TaxID=1517512 RepID=A0A9P3B344_9EURO|nr:uncharacterized protein Asppvi_000172 [Aspergillus pseudoviridinutans]GIJ81673.1 hypothetical protein Asppvi_000172 [Aspergillus pseudoviridinutans]
MLIWLAFLIIPLSLSGAIPLTTPIIGSTTPYLKAGTRSSAAKPFPSNSNANWFDVSSSPEFSRTGFGGTSHSTGHDVSYKGNIGIPYGSNIIEVTSSDAHHYKYVVQFQGSNTNDWVVVIWNKYSTDGVMNGWYGKACKRFTLRTGQVRYFAFNDDSQGGWAAAPGSSIPTDSTGAYASTWGEFDFGSSINSGWSGFDVSAIVAQNAGFHVQGMEICDVLGRTCSSITSNAALVRNAYTNENGNIGGIGGNIPAGPVRLSVTIDYGSKHD